MSEGHTPASAAASVAIVYKDLFKVNAQTRVNTVNCVGVMGKGIALAFKKAFPEMYSDYVKRCLEGSVLPGVPYLYVDNRTSARIINFPTKDHWRNQSKIEYIEQGLQYLVAHTREWEIKSIALPPLGCTNGGLDWNIVRPLMISMLSKLGVPVYVCAFDTE
jgi:O-acetyl-ADP-ribose deacetylase (regulator of RNase III)